MTDDERARLADMAHVAAVEASIGVRALDSDHVNAQSAASFGLDALALRACLARAEEADALERQMLNYRSAARDFHDAFVGKGMAGNTNHRLLESAMKEFDLAEARNGSAHPEDAVDTLGEYEALRQRAEQAEAQRDIYRAVLVGAGYEQLDDLPLHQGGLALATALGAQARHLTLQIIAERDEARKDAAYHADCRPNRREAEAAMADAKAMNDRWADEVKARREAEAERDEARKSVAFMRETWESILAVKNDWEMELLGVCGVLGQYPCGYEGMADLVQAQIIPVADRKRAVELLGEAVEAAAAIHEELTASAPPIEEWFATTARHAAHQANEALRLLRLDP